MTQRTTGKQLLLQAWTQLLLQAWTGAKLISHYTMRLSQAGQSSWLDITAQVTCMLRKIAFMPQNGIFYPPTMVQAGSLKATNCLFPYADFSTH